MFSCWTGWSRDLRTLRQKQREEGVLRVQKKQAMKWRKDRQKQNKQKEIKCVLISLRAPLYLQSQAETGRRFQPVGLDLHFAKSLL